MENKNIDRKVKEKEINDDCNFFKENITVLIPPKKIATKMNNSRLRTPEDDDSTSADDNDDNREEVKNIVVNDNNNETSDDSGKDCRKDCGNLVLKEEEIGMKIKKSNNQQSTGTSESFYSICKNEVYEEVSRMKDENMLQGKRIFELFEEFFKKFSISLKRNNLEEKKDRNNENFILGTEILRKASFSSHYSGIIIGAFLPKDFSENDKNSSLFIPTRLQHKGLVFMLMGKLKLTENFSWFYEETLCGTAKDEVGRGDNVCTSPGGYIKKCRKSLQNCNSLKGKNKIKPTVFLYGDDQLLGKILLPTSNLGSDCSVIRESEKAVFGLSHIDEWIEKTKSVREEQLLRIGSRYFAMVFLYPFYAEKTEAFRLIQIALAEDSIHVFPTESRQIKLSKTAFFMSIEAAVFLKMNSLITFDSNIFSILSTTHKQKYLFTGELFLQLFQRKMYRDFLCLMRANEDEDSDVPSVFRTDDAKINLHSTIDNFLSDFKETGKYGECILYLFKYSKNSKDKLLKLQNFSQESLQNFLLVKMIVDKFEEDKSFFRRNDFGSCDKLRSYISQHPLLPRKGTDEEKKTNEDIKRKVPNRNDTRKSQPINVSSSIPLSYVKSSKSRKYDTYERKEKIPDAEIEIDDDDGMSDVEDEYQKKDNMMLEAILMGDKIESGEKYSKNHDGEFLSSYKKSHKRKSKHIETNTKTSDSDGYKNKSHGNVRMSKGILEPRSYKKKDSTNITKNDKKAFSFCNSDEDSLLSLPSSPKHKIIEHQTQGTYPNLDEKKRKRKNSFNNFNEMTDRHNQDISPTPNKKRVIQNSNSPFKMEFSPPPPLFRLALPEVEKTTRIVSALSMIVENNQGFIAERLIPAEFVLADSKDADNKLIITLKMDELKNLIKKGGLAGICLSDNVSNKLISEIMKNENPI